jgi:hypothetical protein
MINFVNIPERVDASFVLSRLTEESIFEFYGVPVKSGKFLSPLRTDRRPNSCQFYYNRHDRLIYRDWAVEEHHFDCFGLVMYKYGISFGKAVYKIYNNMILGQSDSIATAKKKALSLPHVDDFKEINVQRRHFTKKDLEWWETFGISKETLKYFNVSPIQRAWLNSNPIYYYKKGDECYGYWLGYQQYKLYLPHRKDDRFIGNTRTIQGWAQLPENGEYLVITKSMKDVMLLYEYGIPAIAFHSESETPSEKFVSKMKERFKYIILVYDNDRHGVKAMQRSKNILPCMWLPRYVGKDLSDYYKINGYEKTKNLINYGRQKIKRHESQNNNLQHIGHF